MHNINPNNYMRTINILGGLLIVLLLGPAAFSQTASAPTDNLKPVMVEYKSIAIGTPANEVRHKLGKAEIDENNGLFYRFSNDEFVQIRLDSDHNVRLIAITYSGKNAPKAADVFGAGVKIEPRPDGSIYQLVQYPKAGFWVAYSQSAGTNPTTTVTLQKMRTATL